MTRETHDQTITVQSDEAAACSFCEARRDKVRYLVASDTGAHICDRCLRDALDLILEEAGSAL